MGSVSLHQFLVLYTWFPLTGLLLFMLLIGRFYQKFSGERMYYKLLAAPIALYGIAAVRAAGDVRVTEDLLGALFYAAGGLVLIFLALRMYRRMLTDDKQ